MLATATSQRDLCANYIELDGLLTFPNALQMEKGMLDRVSQAPVRSDPYVSAAVWQTEKSIILPSGMSRRPGVKPAMHGLHRAGWPVFERHTGGDVTPQFDGVLNVSFAFLLAEKDCTIATAYNRLTSPLIAFLKSTLGVDAYLASVNGAFCDGAHNLVVAGKKIGGTAQRWRKVNQPASQTRATAVLGHIALLCGGELVNALNATNTFLEASGVKRRVDPSVHITVEELTSQGQSEPRILAQALTSFLNDDISFAASNYV